MHEKATRKSCPQSGHLALDESIHLIGIEFGREQSIPVGFKVETLV